MATKLVRDDGAESYDDPPPGAPPEPPVPVVEDVRPGGDDLIRADDHPSRSKRSPGQAAFDVFDAVHPMP